MDFPGHPNNLLSLTIRTPERSQDRYHLGRLGPTCTAGQSDARPGFDRLKSTVSTDFLAEITDFGALASEFGDLPEAGGYGLRPTIVMMPVS